MSRDIHHRCRCLDRNFTFEEWTAYLKATGYSDEPVFTSAGFQFNINDVCCNPNTPVYLEWARGHRVILHTAQSPNGRWDCGYDIAVHWTNSLRGAHFIDTTEDGWATEREAIYDALRYAQQLTEREIQIAERRDYYDEDYDDDWPPAKKTVTLRMLRRQLADITKLMDTYDPRQLTLWE